MSKLARLAQPLDAEAPTTVLLVDDNPSLRQALLVYLSSIPGMRVETASTQAQAEALLAFGGERFACAVIDLQSCGPIDNGIVAAIQVHAVPTIMLTPAIDERLRQQLHAANVVDYVVNRQAADLEHAAVLAARLRENHHIKVIVAAASASFRTYVKGLLDNHRYSSLAAASAREALNLLRRHPDASLLLVDFDLSGTSGAELIESVRIEYRLEQLAIIAVA